LHLQLGALLRCLLLRGSCLLTLRALRLGRLLQLSLQDGYPPD
jgi:hypothetical protein